MHRARALMPYPHVPCHPYSMLLLLLNTWARLDPLLCQRLHSSQQALKATKQPHAHALCAWWVPLKETINVATSPDGVTQTSLA